jgi:lipopolysaccharide heptosyltransferase II
MKVLIVRLSAIGDVVQGIPCLVALKESFPDWKISWLVEETSVPILERHPLLDKLFVIQRKWRSGENQYRPNLIQGGNNFWSVLREIRNENFDVAIDLQGLFKSGMWSFLSGAPRRIGHNKTREFAHYFLNEFASERPTFDPTFPLVERYLEPARVLGANISQPHYVLPPSSQKAVESASRLLKNKTRVVALCPWSAWNTKNWPLERWRELANRLSSQATIVLLGAQNDIEAADFIGADNSSVINLVGKTSLDVLPEIFRRSALVIGPDTGLVHLANATGVPKILMLFGSTSWRRSGPLGKDHRTISTELECQPCFERSCPLGHMNCQQLLDVNQVLKAAEQMLLKNDGLLTANKR